MYEKKNELYHHGVKGMKWGVRKKRQKASKKTNRIAKRTINAGKDFANRQMMIYQQQQFDQWAMQEAARASINAGNMASSLSISGGMNPYMFGVM